jgi:hypothetical protein
MISSESYVKLMEVCEDLQRTDPGRSAEPCDPGCPGWGVFETGIRGLEIERCDECGRFEWDDDAAHHVSRLLAKVLHFGEPDADG